MRCVNALLRAAVLVILLPAVAAAQAFVRLQPVFTSDTISSNGDSVILVASGIGGFGAVKVQTLDSYTGTWEVQCSADGTNYDADAELKLVAADGSSVVTSVANTVGIWDVQNAAGCRAIKVISTAGFAATDTVVVISATQSGSGGGSGSASVSTEVTNTGTFAVQNQPFAVASGGCTVGTTTSIIGGASVNETAIKASAGQIYSISGFSLDSVPVYIKLYNDTTVNIDETDTPVYRLGVPANSTAALGAAFVYDLSTGMEFTTAITIRVTKGIADNDTTVLEANEVLVNVCWQ